MNGLKKLIQHPRIPLYLLVLLCVPFFYFALDFYWKIERLEEMENHLDILSQKAAFLKTQQEKEQAFFSSMKEADRFFVDKHLETVVLLEPEVKKLQAMDIETDDILKKRLQFLKSKENRLLFVEEKIHKGEGIQEVEGRQQHPVEMNEEDLKKMLSLIEGHTIGPYRFAGVRPQLIIKQFELSRKTASSQEEVFEVNMQLLKRESLK